MFYLWLIRAFYHAFIVFFINKLNLGYISESWSDGYTLLWHKKGKLDDVNNLKGITLLSSLGKILLEL